MSDAWKRFIAGTESITDVAPVIFRSWQRSRNFHVDYEHVAKNELLPSPLLRERQLAHEDLYLAGRSLLPQIFNFLHGSNYIILLTDNQGCVLDVLGDPTFMSKAQQVSLSPGANWREEVKGTNAIGTAITEASPLQVLGWEHFVHENHFMSCWAAPIKNSQGQIAGILDISGGVGQANKHLLDLVVMGARMFETNLQLRELQRKVGFYRQGVKIAGELLQQGFIAIDKSGIITEINPIGAQLLNRKTEDILGRSASEVFQTPRGWAISNESLNLQFKKSDGPNILSRLRQVIDDSGQSMGAVGLLEPAQSDLSMDTLWVGRSEVTLHSFAKAEKAANTTSTVLITGESGTGKEVMARYIHQLSPRRSGPFIALNCAALPQTLLGSELFGYEEGAFTGARRGGQPGKFELAEGGTIFLDEIGEMPLDFQVTLLRVLQEREVVRLGGAKPTKIDVRVISATHQNLTELVAAGKFRLDLFYRLKVITLDLPPLRQRLEDIWDLAPMFVAKYCHSFGKPTMTIAPDVYDLFFRHTWPGNIRELENCLESTVAMSDGPILGMTDLPDDLVNDVGNTQDSQLLEQHTKQAILQALNQTNRKIAPAARILGIGRNTLYRKLKELDIK